MTDRARWVVLIAAALWLLSAAPASANFVVPLLYFVWPAAWVLLLPIILLEARAAVGVLEIPSRTGLKVAAAANLVSTALGIPVCWFLVADAGFPTDFSVMAVPAHFGLAIDERNRLLLVLMAAIGSCVPFLLVSVACEYLVAARMLKSLPRRQVARWAWHANALSYLLVLAVFLAYFNSAAGTYYWWQRRLFGMTARAGDLASVQRFLAQGMNVDARTSMPAGRTPLMMAAETCRTDLVKLLLDRGANVNARDPHGQTALMLAAQSSLGGGLTIGASPAHRSAVMRAAQRDHAGTVQALVERGAEVDAKDAEGNTAAMWAAEAGNTDVVQLLARLKRR